MTNTDPTGLYSDNPEYLARYGSSGPSAGSESSVPAYTSTGEPDQTPTVTTPVVATPSVPESPLVYNDYGNDQTTDTDKDTDEKKTTEESIFSLWAKKKRGSDLTDEEAGLQKKIGIGEMFLGFAGIFTGAGVLVGAYVMADGAIVFSAGDNQEKEVPFFAFANSFASPFVQIPGSDVVIPLPLPYK